MKRLRRIKRKEKSSRETLEDMFEDLLKAIYFAEKQLVKVLPKLARASFSQYLQETFEQHLHETKVHINRIEECFDFVDGEAVSSKCDVVTGLVRESMEAVENHDDGHVRDAVLIGIAQKIKRYEISAYRTLQAIATVLEKAECARLLEQTKVEESAADIRLAELSEQINHYAAELTEQRIK